LRQEHEELSQLLNKLTEQLRALPLARNTTETVERLRKLGTQISHRLQTHLEEEEKILYPALDAHVPGVSTTLERMRLDHDAGEAAAQVFWESIERLTENGRNREAVAEAGRRYIQWVRGHLLSENGRLFPLLERRLNPKTQREIRRAMEELARGTEARMAGGFPGPAQA
jgi:hemerythrin-like domain-containing protein